MGREGRTDEEDGTPREADRKRPPLPVAVGREPPWKHRQRESNPLGGEHTPISRQEQVVLVAERRARAREVPMASVGEARLRRGSGGEHRPPIARTGHSYSPKGLIGRAPVETITLFVSR